MHLMQAEGVVCKVTLAGSDQRMDEQVCVLDCLAKLCVHFPFRRVGMERIYFQKLGT